MINRVLLIGAIILFTSSAGAAEKGKKARAEIKDAKEKTVGTAILTEKKQGVEIKLKVSGLPPGKHGFHFHDKGVCEPPQFVSAGDHFNPFGKHHGLKNPQGKHAGDLPNLEVKSDGTAEITIVADEAKLGTGPGSLLKEGGTALVIHAGADDEKSDPAGNSGPRIACGVVKAD